MGIQVPQDDPTSAEAWPSARSAVTGFVITLPSGAKARLRRTMDLPELIKSGKIPNPLVDVLAGVISNATEVLEGEADKPKDPPKFKFSDVEEDKRAEAIYGMLEVVDATCVRAFVEPKVMLPPADFAGEPQDWIPPQGALSIFDLTMDDKMFVWQYAMGGPGDLKSFRAATKQTLDAAFDVADVPLPPEQPVGAG